MKQAYIKAISYHLPQQVLTNEDLVREFPEWTAEKVANKVGIDARHIAAEGETAGDMAEQAALTLFDEWGIKPHDIDFLMLCTQSPDYFLPTTACILQHRLGISTSSGAIDYNLGCSGFVYGLAIAKGLVISGVAKNVLVLTSDTYSKHIHPKDKVNRTIFGDAATATLVSADGFAGIGEFSLGTDGSGAENLIVKTGGMKHQKALKEIALDESGAFCSSDNLYMNGSEIFSFTQDNVPLLVADTLAKNGCEKADIDLFVFHQANKYMLSFLRKKIKIEEEKFYYCLSRFGNTVSSTIPIALKEAMSDNSIKPGNKVLIAGFGVGYSWGGVTLNF
ncbi:MAG: ketoacyl-ACP synthase III [Sediminibacterium sp.]|nr:ketoacyl-ACP synthase III [Sediminibacterium sp.]